MPNNGLCLLGGSQSENKRKQKEREEYVDLAREHKELWHMKVTVIPVVVGTLGAIPKELLKGLKDLETRGQVETSQTTALLRMAIIPRRVLVTWGDFLSLKLLWKTIS